MFDFWCLAFLSVWIFTAICIGCTIGMVRARPTLSISQSVCFQLCWSHDEYCVPSSPSLVVQCTLVVRPSTANIPVVAKWAVDTFEVILTDVTWDEDETWSRFWGDFSILVYFYGFCYWCYRIRVWYSDLWYCLSFQFGFTWNIICSTNSKLLSGFFSHWNSSKGGDWSCSIERCIHWLINGSRGSVILSLCNIYPGYESLYSNSPEEAVFSESAMLVTLT